MPRKLRIAVSVFFGVLTLLLVVLWVRSYWLADFIHGPVTHTRGFWFASNSGQIMFALTETVVNTPLSWENHDSQRPRAASEREEEVYGFIGGKWDYWTIWGPHWLPAIAAVTMAIVSWAPWKTHSPIRFSLRSLLIATTLLAVALGLAVWTGR